MRKRGGSSPPSRTNFEGITPYIKTGLLFGLGTQMETDISFLNIDSTLIESPRGSDKLFKWDTDFQMNACISWMHDALPAYASGYKAAADLICESIFANRGSIDSLVYPVCSLYRHYIELRLKEIIKDGYSIFQIERGIPQHHKIYELWKEVKGFAQEIWPEGPSEDLANLDKLILEFDQADPNSQDFRYPNKKDGRQTLGDIKYINIRNLKEVMDRVSTLLDGIACGTGDAKSWAMEARSYGI